MNIVLIFCIIPKVLCEINIHFSQNYVKEDGLSAKHVFGPFVNSQMTTSAQWIL